MNPTQLCALLRSPSTRPSPTLLTAPNPALGPSVVNDQDGIETGHNAIYASDGSGGFFWAASETFLVPGDWVIPMPAGLDAFTAMALGTAGFTAALAIHRMEQNGQAPAGGAIAVTGATGGVGSLAIDMLSVRGYRVVAVSGKADAVPYLKELGASEVLAAVLVHRGHGKLSEAQAFLAAELPRHDPFALGDMHEACEAIRAAIAIGTKSRSQFITMDQPCFSVGVSPPGPPSPPHSCRDSY